MLLALEVYRYCGIYKISVQLHGLFFYYYDMMLSLEFIHSGMVFGFFAALCAVVLSPFQYIKVIRQETVQSYRNILCNSFLEKRFSIFFRGALPYASMQFVSSFAYGFSYHFASLILTNNTNIIFAIVFRSLFGGIVETLCTAYLEVSEISKNKGALMHTRGHVSTIIAALLMRNSVFWIASIAPLELAKIYSWSENIILLSSFLFGIVIGIITTPVDVVATRMCGSESKISFWSCFASVLANRHQSLLGGNVRVAQNAIYAIQTELVAMYLI